MGALLAGLPLLLGGLGCLVSACLMPAAREALTGSIAMARRIIADHRVSSAPRPASSSSRASQDPVRAMFVLGMAGFFNDFVMPGRVGGPGWISAAAMRARCRAR